MDDRLRQVSWLPGYGLRTPSRPDVANDGQPVACSAKPPRLQLRGQRRIWRSPAAPTSLFTRARPRAPSPMALANMRRRALASRAASPRRGLHGAARRASTVGHGRPDPCNRQRNHLYPCPGLRSWRADRRCGPASDHPAFPEARLGRAGRSQDLDPDRPRRARGDGRSRRPGGRDRPHQPARDHRLLEQAKRGAAWARHRLAGPAHRAPCSWT